MASEEIPYSPVTILQDHAFASQHLPAPCGFSKKERRRGELTSNANKQRWVIIDAASGEKLIINCGTGYYCPLWSRWIPSSRETREPAWLGASDQRLRLSIWPLRWYIRHLDSDEVVTRVSEFAGSWLPFVLNKTDFFCFSLFSAFIASQI